ncbi:hypothetical protein H0H93_015349 [Arthromyces matolae]|nr:hypothetical protein H0H93_015349 [Arthromyces matolae]
MGDLVGDLVCVLEDAGVSNAICMGHDWGSQLCYEAARMRPDMFVSVIGVVVPYTPSAGPFVPVRDLVPALPKLNYQVYFDSQLEKATDELDRDIRRTLRGTLRSGQSPPPDAFLRSNESFLGAWAHVKEIDPIPFLSPDEEEYLIEQYRIQGFKYSMSPPLNNRHASWELAHKQGNFTVTVPVLAIYPLNDPVADWRLAAKILKTAEFVSILTTQVNAIIGGWLRNLETSDEEGGPGRGINDEL